MAKESPLIEVHRYHGARLGEEGGWVLPVDFGDPLKEYEAARSRVGLFDLSHRALLCFTGADRAPYLHGMVSNNVNALMPGKGMYAGFLDVNGKILADARILATEDAILVDIWEPLKEKILTHLNRYLVADEVEIADWDQQSLVSLQGNNAEPVLKEWLQSEIGLTEELDHTALRRDGVDFRIVRAPRTGGHGYDLVLPLNSLAWTLSRIEKIGEPFGLRWVGAQAQEILRIERGIPRYGVDMDENNLVLETGLDRAISFNKGCYLGQEIVERIYSRGHVNKRLVGLVLDGEKPAGGNDRILRGTAEVGKITSSVLSPALKCAIALGYVQSGHNEPGTPLTVDTATGAIAARVSSLPLV